MHETQAVEDHGLDDIPHGDKARFGRLLRRLVKNIADAEFVEHPSDQVQAVQDFTEIDSGYHDNRPQYSFYATIQCALR